MDMHKNYDQYETNDPLAELRSLLAAFSARELTGEQYIRIQHLAIESEASWRLYLQHMFMYGALHRKQCNRNHREIPEQSFGISREKMEEDSPSSNNSIFPLLDMERDLLWPSGGVCDQDSSEDLAHCTDKSSHGRFENPTPLFSIFTFFSQPIPLAIIMICVLVLPMVMMVWNLSTITTPNVPPTCMVPGQVVKAVACIWDKKHGAGLQAGDLLIGDHEYHLKEGILQLDLASGVQTIIQGPAVFRPKSSMLFELTEGRLSAKVSPKGKDFMVMAGGLEVIDRGTEFGVFVNKSIKDTAEVHVFKGLVEVGINASVPSKATIKLTKDEAIACNTKTSQITRIPVNHQAFARDLDSLTGVTLNLNLSNPGFEFPDIRAIPEFQPKHGDTGLWEIQGWKYSGVQSDGLPIAFNEISRFEPYVCYQISPYKSPKGDRWDVGPGATEGKQVVTVKLNSEIKKAVRQAWIYQSLGTVGVVDIGRRLLLEVDAGPRTGFSDGAGTLVASFATHVTQERAGIPVGASGTLNVTDDKQGMKTIQAILPITSDLIGQDLFVVLTATDKKYSQYHFDNVRVSLLADKQDELKEETNPSSDDEAISE